MTSIKNEHFVWGYADQLDGKGKLVIIGLTPQGIKYLQNTPGAALPANPPGNGFANVTQILVTHVQDKVEMKEIFRKAGVDIVSEVH